MAQTPLEFTDLRTKTKFVSNKYELGTTSKGMIVAKTISPSGTLTTRMVSRV